MWNKYLAIPLTKTLESLSVRAVALCEDSVTELLWCHASINIEASRFSCVMLAHSSLLC